MKRKENSIRSLVIVIAALFMSAFYVVGPLHEQISDWTHSLSHNIEKLNVHASPKSQEDTHRHTDHDYNNHKKESVAHGHGIIKLFDSFFDSTNQESSSNEDSLWTNIKIDKHLVTYSQHLNFEDLKISYVEVRCHNDTSPKDGYLKKMVKPPANKSCG